jgi:PhoH-like ATPase
MVKTFIVDTNVLLEDPQAIFRFKNSRVVIPFEVLQELDNHKTRQDLVGMNARESIRQLDKLRQEGSLIKGVPLENGGDLLVVPKNESANSNDHAIILAATLFENSELITNDVAMRVMAETFSVPSSSYEWNNIKKVQDIYTGAQRLEVDQSVIDEFYGFGTADLPPELIADLHPNQFLIAKSYGEEKSAIGRYADGRMHRLQIRDKTTISGLLPKNKEQQFALDLLMNPNIPLVTLIGSAGCGKSLMAVAAGMEQVLETQQYNKMIVSRPIQPLGKDIGFLPGSMEEKMAPWIQPIKDCLEIVVGKNKQTIDMLFDNGTIEIEAITYIRGRSIPRSYVIIDEAQNLSVPEMKAIVTRIGQGSKLVITGDIEQIDRPHFDSHSNGLAYLIEKMKDQSLSGHITLLKGERSELATLAAKIL